MGEKLIRASDARRAILNIDPKCAYCIDSILAVDAVEVVRCKDCKMRCPESICIAKHCTLTGIPVDDDDFCSYGERRNYD